ncbi:MAG TPA: asparagine synthase (glutamine-hydrolyzing) [Bacteroidia bacterium]|nr:asparagine synthase (glutamine-hydrolyzing) [Bacteroidia bacterium]
MCGIAGLAVFDKNNSRFLDTIVACSKAMELRGPDHEGFFRTSNVALAHRRLSIIDTSDAANQPMFSKDGRYVIVFNGEFFNFSRHREQLIQSGMQFKTTSDTEVLLELFIKEGISCLEKVNGFFAFAVYDTLTRKMTLARDRMGVKPLYYFLNDDFFGFASEMKGIVQLGVPRELDTAALCDYLHLNYIPGQKSILKGVLKLLPGHFAELELNDSGPSFKVKSYYRIPDTYRSNPSAVESDYKQASSELSRLLDKAVQRRLVSDVPLGAFLSGGIDSSVVVGLASRHVKGLKTFSIGFRDEPHFDETHYARLVADKFKTDHTEFSLTTDDLYSNLFAVLDYLDEPFADSSSLAVNILSMHTRKHVTVALSGDGADELFGGYNKHKAEWLILNKSLFTKLLKPVSALLSNQGGSRNGPLSNKLRQLHRFAEGVSLSPQQRYWRWCGFTTLSDLKDLLVHPPGELYYHSNYSELLAPLGTGSELNDFLYMDMQMVLPDDMLVKVDRMSMAHSLEVRSPFLDYEVVNYSFQLPDHFKIDKQAQKKILKDSFKDMLPEALMTRGKQGFEVPLLTWLRGGLNALVTELLLDKEFISSQGIFRLEELRKLHTKLHSSQPGDATARIWALIVFQYWWKKHMVS